VSAHRRVAGLLSPPIPKLRSAPALGRPKPTLRDAPALVADAFLRHRRIVTAGCVALAVAIGLSSLTPAKPRLVRVVAAAHDLAAGTILKPADVRWVALPVGVEPAGVFTAMSDVVGRAAVDPIRDGEAITDVRLDGGGSAGDAADPLAPPGDGLVATPVRLADGQAAALLRVGEHVDVLAATPPSGGSTISAARVVADDARVVAMPTPSDGEAADSTSEEGALVVLAATPDQAKALAQAELTSRLSAVVVR
jgi:pilus assembly protein CpaB